MKKRAVPLLLAVISAYTMTCPALAAETPTSTFSAALYPVEVIEYTAGDLDEFRISKTYELSPMDDPTRIPTGNFERSGCLYTLLDIIKEDQTETDSKYYTETVTLDSKSKDMEEIMPLLAVTCEAATEDGYSGVLTLGHIQHPGKAFRLRHIYPEYLRHPQLPEPLRCGRVSGAQINPGQRPHPHPGRCGLAAGRRIL